MYISFVGAGTAAGAAAAGAAMMAAGTGMMMMNPTMMLFPMILAGASFAKVLLLYILHLKIALKGLNSIVTLRTNKTCFYFISSFM